MRITGGNLGGRFLQCPKGDSVRPTSDKVRLAIFNMLQSYIALENCNVLDAFCGTGALGLEALSRGAEKAVFVDKSKKSLSVCKKNASSLCVTGQSMFFQGDARKVTLDQKFHLVFLDPPYQKNLIVPALQNLSQSCFEEGALCVIEMAKEEELSLDTLRIEKEKIYGDTKIIIAQITSI